MPHEVGYITRGEGQNIGTVPDSSKEPSSSVSKDKLSSSASSSIPKPTPEELVELKAIMKGHKQLSEDKTKRARQKEIMKLMMAKKSDGSSGTSSSVPSASIKPSANSATADTLNVSKPTSEELTELKTIIKGEKQFSEDKMERARQKELMKQMMARKASKTGGSAPSFEETTPKKGVRFDDQAVSVPVSKLRSSSGTQKSSPSADIEAKSLLGRSGSSSRSTDPVGAETRSSASSSGEVPSGGSSSPSAPKVSAGTFLESDE